MSSLYYVRRLLVRRLTFALGVIALTFGLLCLLLCFRSSLYDELRIAAAIIGGGSAFFGLLALFLATRPPTTDIMHLAKDNHGLLTLSDIVTTLNVSPQRARRGLRILEAHRMAFQRWQEFRKNLWEFPDYMTLPLSESIEIAKAQGGRLRLEDLTTFGHSPEIALRTFAMLRQKGLAQPDPASTGAALIVTAQ